MRIAIDARELTGRATGVGRYLSELLTEWAASPAGPAHDWRLYVHRPVTVPEPLRGGVRLLPGEGGTFWEQWTLARALGAERPDVLFAPGYSAPLTAPCPTVVTVHDVSFSAHPEWFSWREGARRRLLTAWSARRAGAIVTDTLFSRDEIVRHLGLPAARIRVVMPGIRPRVAPAAGRQPIVLFVGSIFRRRNVDRLIDGFARRVAAHLPDARLEIVGENRSHPPLDLDLVRSQYSPDIQARIALRSYVDEPTLQELYGKALVFAFPSTYEGFGLGPLEALAAGLPPVVVETAIAMEVYGPAARYVRADADAIGGALHDLLTSEAARAEILREAPAVLSRYDWSRSAASLLTILQEAALA